MARAKKRVKKPEIVITTVSLTPDEVQILQRLSEDASDVVGRRISGSAVLRAVVQWLGAHDLKFTREQILPLIEKELLLLRWGRKK